MSHERTPRGTDRPKSETIELDDMRMFGQLFAESGSPSIAAAARALGLPKQTVSRRLARLEASLGVDLVHRAGRSMRLTSVGVAYAAQCSEIARRAEQLNRDVADAARGVRGALRVTADPVFGEAFLAPLLVEYASRYPDVKLEVVLTRDKVDLVRRGFDVAFRVGAPVDGDLRGIRLGPARVRYCASASWARRSALPLDSAALASADALVVAEGDAEVRWPLPSREGVRPEVVRVRHRFSSLRLALEAARGGLGVGLFPEFVCADDLRRGDLVDVLGFPVDVGAVWLLYSVSAPSRRTPPPRVSAFVSLARTHFSRAPWSGDLR